MKALFGGILIAIGILIAGASGLCTLTLLSSANGRDGLLPILFGGGIPLAIGFALIYAGRVVVRPTRGERRR
ncbi:MAG TPA: hypothetical protein VGC30_04695 [Dokdonella sp.]